MEVELEKFRSDWIKEVKREPKSDNTSKALDLFMKASQEEQAGGYKNAIEYYRQAIKLDPEIEFKYRKLVQKMPVPKRAVVEEEVQVPLERLTLATWKGDDDHCPILDLPREILSLIVGYSIFPRLDAILPLMLSCKSIYKIFLNDFVWRGLCIHAHHTCTISELENVLPNYQNSWKCMWMEKARVRRDGIYISKCSYKRTGWSDTLTYLQPVHIVTYYRYLRLFKDLSFIFITTPLEPSEIVPVFQPRAKLKEMVHGSWNWESSDVIRLEWHLPHKPSMVFCATLKVLALSTGKFHKLKWSNIS
jgi:F-box protein 9